MSTADELLRLGGLRVEVTPEPTPDEAAVIVAAVRRAKARNVQSRLPDRSRWLLAARGESVRSEMETGADRWQITARLESQR